MISSSLGELTECFPCARVLVFWAWAGLPPMGHAQHCPVPQFALQWLLPEHHEFPRQYWSEPGGFCYPVQKCLGLKEIPFPMGKMRQSQHVATSWGSGFQFLDALLGMSEATPIKVSPRHKGIEESQTCLHGWRQPRRPQPNTKNYRQQRNAEREQEKQSSLGKSTPTGYPIPNGQPWKGRYAGNSIQTEQAELYI